MHSDGQIDELNILRGIAVAFMVVNHFAYALLSQEVLSITVINYLVDYTSFAPVLFFFVTGLGAGLRYHFKGASGINKGLLDKIILLAIADIIMRGVADSEFGWDFLGFIAISMLVVGVVESSRAPVRIAMLLLMFVIGIRFVINPLLLSGAGLGVQGAPLLEGVLGRNAIGGISYWFSPWLAYPLFGFIIGSKYNVVKRYMFIQVNKLSIFFLFALPFLGLIAVDVFGAAFFRWGTVNSTFFIASFMVLALVWCMSNMASMVSTSPKLQKSMGLRGVSSLAAVPVHYFLLDLLVDFAGSDWRIELWLLCVVLALVITFWVSKIVDRLAKEVQLTKLQIILALCLVILLPLVANTIFNSELMSYSFKFVGLLGVCLLLNQKSKIFFR